jgi:hypothetical protein
LPDFFLLLPSSKADFILFFILPPAVDLSNGGCMKKPWVGLGHMDLSGIKGIKPTYANLNFSTE